MSKLTAKQRDKLKPAQFAGPHGSYPVENKAHAVDAKARATQEYDHHRISKKLMQHIDAKANAAIKKSK